MRPLGILIPILFLFVPTLTQVSANNAVFVFAEHGARNSKCMVENEVVGPEGLIKYHDTGNCGLLPVAEYIDFENFSIITYQMGGDCRISGSARVTLDRKHKLYTVHLSKTPDRCRAFGTYSGWLQIKKIPEGFGVEFEENTVEGRLEQVLKLQPGSQEYVSAGEADLKGCIWLGLGEQKYISSAREYLSEMRQDAQTESCGSNLRKLDFAKFAYMGVSINSGYCRRPADLSYRVLDFGGSQNYVVQILFTGPGETCRALSKYDLWIQVPQTPRK